MTDRKKVINALGRCKSYGYCEDKDCPYYENVSCLELLRKDALELLKKQEPVEPILALNDEEHELWQCGNCKVAVFTCGTKYCHNCGKAVKWYAAN